MKASLPSDLRAHNAQPKLSPRSWKPEVVTDSSGKWYGNALRFPTEAEALANATDLAGRWLSVRDFRAAPSDDAPNYNYTSDGRLVPITEVKS